MLHLAVVQFHRSSDKCNYTGCTSLWPFSFSWRLLVAQLPVAPQIEVSCPSIEGLTSISRDLGLLDNELWSPFTELLSQIQADVSSLEGRVRSLALTMDCPATARPKGETRDTSFPHSHLYLTLTKVQRYLDKLLLHKDKLKVC
ncbi:Leptin b [Scophthalmus maximus]|uniref:Leptin b n=1 Tax=Scophthalmus maximus TaxID=52904 RepID=A0A2U9B2W5_SCOMX|nr:Leptin b [Scophthalmus maximus]